MGGAHFCLLDTNGFHGKAKSERFTTARSPSRQKCTKKRAARAARLFFLFQPIKSLVCGADVTVAVRHFLDSLMTTFFPPSNPERDVNVVSLACLFVNMKGLVCQ